MALASPRKLPRGKADTYSIVALSDTSAVTPLLSDLSIAACNPSVEADIIVQPVSQESEADTSHGDSVVTVSTRMSCACCAVEFSHRTEQRAHFKSDWHRYNLKQHLRGDASITEDQFEAMTGEVSSISGSEDSSTSSTEEEAGVKPTAIPARLKRLQARDSTDTTDSEGEDNAAIMAATRKHPKVFLRNGASQLISLYRCVLYHKKTSPNTPAELLSLAQQAQNYTRVAVVMLAGGHFSAAIFDRSEAVVHKTFHRYVVRAKRGTVQSVRDNQGSAPKSAGASLRRYNEGALTQEIQELLSGWSQHLQACHLIFLRTSTYSRHIFFGGKTPIFGRDDTRVRTIPFTSGRPTFNEAKRVHQMLMSVECFGDESLVKDFVPISPPRHLHPDTGQLVVRPDTAASSVSGGRRAKDRKAKEEKVEATTGRPEDVVTNGDDDDQSDVEIELVETTEVIPTDDLQEFACSVTMPKKNKKRRRKGGQKGAEKETSLTESADRAQDIEEMSEEVVQLRNRAYTCCKSGNVTQLSELLERLTLHNSPGHRPSSGDHRPDGAPGDSQNPDHGTGPDYQPAHPPVITHNAQCHSDDHKHMFRTSTTDCESKPDSIEQTEVGSFHQDTTSNELHNNNSTSRTEQAVQPSVANGEVSCSVPHRHTGFPQNLADTGTCRHLPCDTDPSARGRFEQVVLGKYGEKGCSLLHVASSSGHSNIIAALLQAGCDPSMRDSAGKTPYTAASSKEVRNAFRRFRGDYPDRYDYESAQIPGALTADMEAEKKQREADKRKQQKKAKQERLKERKAEEAKAAQEQKEKDRFLALSDREKRALAAEKRLLAQAAEQGAAPVLKRCFQCGVDISGKVPFEYMQFQFCTPKCLKEHRMKAAK